jgi:hypothetical protein
MIDPELKNRILAAFADGCTPVDAVINFEQPFEVIKALYEEHAQSKGGMVVWGDDAKQLEQLLGCPIRSGDDLISGLDKAFKDAKARLSMHLGREVQPDEFWYELQKALNKVQH